MTHLHELLAVEKTRTAAWHTLLQDTLKKFAKPHMFQGSLKTLAMLESTPANQRLEAAARTESARQTDVLSTLEYALDIFAVAEDVQASKNATNAKARGTVMWSGVELLVGLPIDELLGLEDRLKKLREVIVAVPTLDASKNWVPDPTQGVGIWKLASPEITTKTEKTMTPVVLSPATEHHPANVVQANKDIVVDSFTENKWTGEATALQKANAIKLIDELSVEVKAARMRANMEQVVDLRVGAAIAKLILDCFRAPAQ